MDAKTAKRAVIWSLAGSGTIVVVEKAVHGEWPSPKIFLAGAVLFVILGFAAEFAPQIAAPFAVLVFLAILLSKGGTALGGVSKAVNKSRVKSTMTVIPGGKPATPAKLKKVGGK